MYTKHVSAQTECPLNATPFGFCSGEIPEPPLTEFYDVNGIELYNNDCLDAIWHLEDECIDLAITSPPYNVDLGNNTFRKDGYDLYRDSLEHAEYIQWLRTIFSCLYPKLRRGARVCINIADGKNGRIPTHADIAKFMAELRYIPFTSIIWNKNQVGNRLAWGSWRSPSCPSFPTPFEFIPVFAKEDFKLQTEGETDLTPEEFKLYANAYWTIAPESQMRKIGHPAMFPIEIPRRLIKMLSWKGATVLDLFNGAGTTGLACQQLGRQYIGIELSKNYCDISVRRWKKNN